MTEKEITKGQFLLWIRKNMTINTVTPFIATIGVIVIFQIINPAFLSYQGMVTIAYAMSYFLITACGLTLVIMMGSFDFSVVSVMKLSALICVLYIDEIGLLVIPFALAISLGIGFINGILFAKLKVPSFMATLGISIVIDGIALLMSRGFLLMMNHEGFRSIAVTFIGSLPSIFYWAIIIWIFCTLMALITPFGRRIYAIGGNPKAAALSGINIDRNRIAVFMLSSFFSGVAGLLYMAQLGGGSVKMGTHMMIPLLASVVAGGTALKGGSGGPHRTILGVVIVTWIQSGLLMNGVGRDVQVVVLGFIAIIMTIATTDRGKMSRVIIK